jgi:glutamyl-tRNA reductase
MSLLALGINHNTASVNIREQVAFAPETMQEALIAGCVQAQLDELVVLSTCNRTELYVCSKHTHEEIQERVLRWLAHHHQLVIEQLQPMTYVYTNSDAVRHLMRVASGLDSMVLGEPQILGQLKSAYAVAKEAATVGSQLHRTFKEVFAIAKQVRTETAIGENPVSVAFGAVTLAQQIFSDIHKASALMIGAGRTIELVVQHLQEAGVKNIVVANRTLTNARELCEKYGVREVLLADVPKQLVSADIVVSSTASQLPILGKGAVETALKERKYKPIFMVDLAVPRDIEEQVGELDDVYLYSVDDLRGVIDSNLRNRQAAAEEAEVIISSGVAQYERRLRGLNVVGTLRSFREKAEQIRDTELNKALSQLERGEAPQKVLQDLARLLTSKLIHSPSVQMKKASADGQNELIELAEQLFELEASNEPEVSPLHNNQDTSISQQS